MDRVQRADGSLRKLGALMLARGTRVVNGFADRAGRHRRIASGFALLAAPVGLMGVASIYADGPSTFAFCHFAVAASFLWLSSNLIRSASLVDDRGIPHPSIGALAAAVVVLRLSAPMSLTLDLGSRPPLILSMVGLGASLAILVQADRNSGPLTAIIGRTVLVFSGLVFGVTQLVRMLNGISDYSLYSIGLGVVGLLMLAMAQFEARLLWRSIQWLLPRAGR